MALHDWLFYGWHPEAPLFLSVSAGMATLVYLFDPALRHSLRRSLLVLLLVAGSLLLAGVLERQGFRQVAAIVAEVAAITTGLVLIRIWAQSIFALIRTVRRRAPARLMLDIAIVLAYAGWGLIRLRQAGLDLSQIVTTSAVITAVLAFSMQDTLGNILAGMALQLDDSIAVGDWVKVEDLIGRVVDIGWRATRIETRNGETVVLPNSVLMKGRFMLLGRRENQPEQWRRSIPFAVSLDILPATVIEAVERALRKAHLPRVATTPPPDCVLMSLDHGMAHFVVRYWLTDLAVDDPTDSGVRLLIDAALRRQGQQCSPPLYRVLMSEDERLKEARRQRHQEERLRILRPLELFASFSDEELAQLAAEMHFAPYVAGDTVLRQGDASRWLYIIASGEVEISRSENGGPPVRLGQLETGQFFGEMGLLTGQAASANVVALTRLECYRLDREAFKQLLARRQELASEMSLALERRLAEQHRLAEARAQQPLAAPPRQHEILDRLRRFLGLDNTRVGNGVPPGDTPT